MALWDVIRTCRRRGSGDADIREPAANAIGALLAAYPGIRTIVHNGRLSQSLFDRLAAGQAQDRMRVLMPSTSPAHTLAFDDKLAVWRALREAAEREHYP